MENTYTDLLAALKEQENRSRIDHDLIVIINEQLKQTRIDMAVDRATAVQRSLKTDTEFEAYKQQVSARLVIVEERVDKLRMSWAQLSAVVVVLSSVVGALFKIFWK